MALCAPEYLREHAKFACNTSGHAEALRDAADEIERLQAEIVTLRNFITGIAHSAAMALASQGEQSSRETT